MHRTEREKKKNEKKMCIAKIGQFKLTVMAVIYIKPPGREKRRKQTEILIK